MRINGKDYTLSYDIGTFRYFARKANRDDVKINDLGALMSDITLAELDVLAWCSLKVNNSDFDMSLDDFHAYLDDHPDLLNDIGVAFTEGIPDEVEAGDIENSEQGKPQP